MDNATTLTEEEEALVQRVLYDSMDQLAVRCFKDITSLVAMVGDSTAAALLRYTADYFTKMIFPFLRRGLRINVQEDIGYAWWMARNRRLPCPQPPRNQKRHVDFHLVRREMAWRMETRLWEAGLVCLKGIRPSERNEVYLTVMSIFEVIFLMQKEVPEMNGRGNVVKNRIYRELNEKWARGLLPDDGEVFANAHWMLANRGALATDTAPCWSQCKCGPRKREARLVVLKTDARRDKAPGVARPNIITIPTRPVPRPVEELP